MILWKTSNLVLIPILSAIGFIFNLLSTVVFSLIIIKNEQRDDMYKYLLWKSICEMLGCFFSVLNPIYYLYYDIGYYILTIWYIWFWEYIIKALFVASTGFEIAATFNCAISIEKRMKWCQTKLSFWFWIVSVLILSFGIGMFRIFTYSIQKFVYLDEFNKTVYEYFTVYNLMVDKFGTFSLAEEIIKVVLFLFILLTLNCYILFKLIQIGKRKKRLNTNSSNVQNSNRAENRKIIMIVVLFLTFLFGHLPNFLYFAFNNDQVYTRFWSAFTIYGEIFLYFSYSTSFFVYFAFNNIFRRLFLRIIRFRSFII
jgi:hypothetical protein